LSQGQDAYPYASRRIAVDISRKQLAKLLDYALVRPTVTDDEVSKGCEIARRLGVAIVSVMPDHIALVASLLKGTDVLAGASIAFPHGSATTAAKVYETEDALGRGAQEIDVVMNIGAFLSGRYDDVQEDIAAVKRVAGAGILVKVILEVAYLTAGQIVKASRLVEAAGADFVKTSTGFAPSGATPEIVRLIRSSVRPRVRVKAAQGIRTYEQALALLEAGAARLGVSSTEAIMQGWDEHHGQA
jgi:deoxyribose-phosphate aldolase